MAAEPITSFIWVAPIVLGIIISLVELFFVHADEGGLGWLGHGLHAIPTTIMFTFISMNVPWVMSFSFMDFMPAWAGTFVIPAVIGLIAAIKVKAAAAIASGGTVGEKLWHALVIGLLIAIAPFIWPLVAGFLPAYLQQ